MDTTPCTVYDIKPALRQEICQLEMISGYSRAAFP